MTDEQFKVVVHATAKATAQERKAFLAAARALEETLNDSDFWYQVSIHYNSWFYKKKMSNGRYQTFKDFKEDVLNGSDKFNKMEDRDMDVYVNFYYSSKSVVGYTYPTTWWTWINRRIFKGFDIGDIAGNIAHEDRHNDGFGHPNADRRSVNYQFGYEVRDFINNKRNDPEQTPIKVVYKRSLWQRIKSLFRRWF